ncbi:MAG: molybdenum cofactor guanylyltransferase [Nitrospirota bacterium]
MNGIILAGGENRRMGRDKAFLDIDGRPMIAHILDVFSKLFERIIVVTNMPDRYRNYDVDVTGDVLDIRGPLTGIYSGLLRSTDEYNFVAACDMPFLNPRLISYMGKIAAGQDAVVPQFNGFLEPLHAIYSKRTLSTIESHIRSNERRIYPIFDHLDVRYLTEDEIHRFDPDRRSLKNINTPEEYKEAVCLD